MAGALDVPSRVLALDDARVGARPPLGEEPADEFADRVAPDPEDGVAGVTGEAALRR